MSEIRVLLVDDEERYLLVAAKIFRRNGIAAEICSDARNVVTRVRETQSQVVVLDLKMPGVTGQDVLRCLKASMPEVQVIILTGHATSEDAAMCMTGGAFDFLVKPVDMDALIARVRRAHDMWLVMCAHERT